MRLSGDTKNNPEINFLKLHNKKKDPEEWLWIGFLKVPFRNFQNENASVEFRAVVKKEIEAAFVVDNNLWREIEAMSFYRIDSQKEYRKRNGTLLIFLLVVGRSS